MSIDTKSVDTMRIDTKSVDTKSVDTMRIDTHALLRDLRPVLSALRDDLLERAKLPGVRAGLRTTYQAEKSAQRTADPFDVWQRHRATQVAAAWVLSVMFVRTLEDRDLLDRRRIAGPGAEDSEQQFFTLAPFLSVRDYLLTVFRELAQLPGAFALFDSRHNPVWVLGPSANAARKLVDFFRQQDADGHLLYQFGKHQLGRDESGDTRFLGDIYQDLDDDVRKRYALLQTPDFVESFILDDTLDPAIRTFGLENVRLIDPTCGSGHFLLGAFARLLAAWREAEPATDAQILAQRAIAQVYGADLNPYAVAIARFRLTVAFLEASGLQRLADAPPLALNLCVADSLLHGVSGQTGHLDSLLSPDDYADESARQFWGADLFALEDKHEALRILGQRYHAVVGNPPYINVKDAKLRDEYRKHYKACHRGYQLVAPFTERFFDLATKGGYVGAIVGNGFMKREFGKKLIEEVLPRLELTKVIDTSGAYIPGHGTPTVILFGRKQPPSDAPVLAAMGKRGEPATPEDPTQGAVWSSIRDHHTDVGFENDYISIAEVDRERFKKHPWTLTGGGASELKQLLEERCELKVGDIVESIGRTSVVGEDPIFMMENHEAERIGLGSIALPLVIGEAVRDWSISGTPHCLYPYDEIAGDCLPEDYPNLLRYFWPFRTTLRARSVFGKGIEDKGCAWYEHLEHYRSKLRTPLSIAFAFVATHNHFVLDRGGKVFNRSAPIIKLPEDATEEDHLALLGYLNSSTAAFYIRQTSHSKGAQGINEGHKAEQWEQFLEFSGARVGLVPIPAGVSGFCPFQRIAGKLCELSQRRESVMPRQAVRAWYERPAGYLADELTDCESLAGMILARMCSIQEELDWLVYEAFGLLSEADLELLHRARGEAVPAFPRLVDTSENRVASLGLFPGHRAFEVVLARDTLTSGRSTSWFDRNGYASPGTIRKHYAPAYQRLIEARVAIIDQNKLVRLIERPEYKRRWILRNFRAELEQAGVATLMDATECEIERETTAYRADEVARTVLADSRHAQLADALFPDSGDLVRDVEACIREASAPHAAPSLLKEPGLDKYRAWLRLWQLQRREDAGGSVGEIPPPPKFKQSDFAAPVYWRLRGKLNVPKERFISYPGAESDEDPSPLYGWAGWDHLERAQALAALYQRRKNEDGWDFDRLMPLLVGLWELVPWLEQWHNEPSAEYGGARMGEFFADFVSQQVREAGRTTEDLEAWRPPKKKRGGGRKGKGKGAGKGRKKATRKESGVGGRAASSETGAGVGDGDSAGVGDGDSVGVGDGDSAGVGQGAGVGVSDSGGVGAPAGGGAGGGGGGVTRKSGRRGGRKPKVTPEQIVKAVRAISAENGGEGASQAKVAQRLEVSAQVVARAAKPLLEQGTVELVSKRPKVFLLA